MASVAVAEIKLVELLHSRVRKRPFTDVGSPDRPYRGRFRSRRGASHEALVRFNGPITPSHYVHDGWLDTSLAARNSATSADLAKSTPIAQYAALNLPIILTTVAPRWFEYDFMAAVLHYAAEASEVFAFLVILPGTCAAVRKWARRYRRRRYRPRHARRSRSIRRARHRAFPPQA